MYLLMKFATQKMTVPRLRGNNHPSNGTVIVSVIMDREVATIVHLRQAFDKPMHELRSALDTYDNGCPNQHYTRVVSGGDVGWGVIELHGHPLVCSNDRGCRSQLRILTAASTHYGVLRTLLNHVYTARRSHLGAVSIDKALSVGDFQSLMEITKVHDFADLLTADLDSNLLIM